MGRVAHSRLDELRKCAQPMSWMDDDEVIDVLNELWSARETINDVSDKLIQDERQLAAQAAEIERLKAKHQQELDCVSSKWELEWKCVVWKKDAELAANAATIAAQAAEIERLKNRVHSENRSVFELNEKLHESRRIESAQAHGIELLREELAALRSQLKEQRAEGK
jgi:phage-related tail protein